MLVGINQDTQELLPEIRKYGCLFLCFAYSTLTVFTGKEGVERLNRIFKELQKKGCINDSETDPYVKDHQGVADAFAIYANYDNMHHKAEEDIPDRVAHVFGRYVYGNIQHFVVLNKDKSVKYDPLIYSKAVTKGKLKDMRWYYAV